VRGDALRAQGAVTDVFSVGFVQQQHPERTTRHAERRSLLTDRVRSAIRSTLLDCV
jgi:hypothetical protein